MIELLAEKRRANGKELCNAAGVTTVKPFLLSHINRGLVLVSEASAGKRFGKTYLLADGVTLEMLLEVGDKKPTVRYSPPPAPETILPISITEKSDSREQTESLFIDAAGRLVVQFPNVARQVFPALDTQRIKRLLAAVDLESLASPVQPNRSHNDHPA